jgi:hypothetical protein
MHGKACVCATVTGRECVARVPATYSADGQAHRSESGEGRCTRRAAAVAAEPGRWAARMYCRTRERGADRNAGLLGYGSRADRANGCR